MLWLLRLGRRGWLKIYLIMEIIKLFFTVLYRWIYWKWRLGLCLFFNLMFSFLLCIVMVYNCRLTHILLRIKSYYIFWLYFSYNLWLITYQNLIILFHIHIFLLLYFTPLLILTTIINLQKQISHFILFRRRFLFVLFNLKFNVFINF